MDGGRPYDEDFVGWTERQAALLRALPPGAHGLDPEHLAEEIEDLGRAEVRQASSLLRQLLIHLIKLAAQPEAPAARHWVTEATAFQGDAVLACTGGLRRRVELGQIWGQAVKVTRASLEEHGASLAPMPTAPPLGLDALLDDDFDVQAAASRLRALLALR